MSGIPEPIQSMFDKAGYFRASLWQSLLTKAALATGCYDAVCPFGFELSGDNKWLSRPLYRFYVLVGGDIPPLPEGNKIGRPFARHVMDLLSKTDPEFFNKFAFIRVNRTLNFRLKGPDYVATETDALLGVLTLSDKRGALHAYADYFISLLASPDFSHGEFTFFDRFPRVRRRLIQLTYMAIWLAESLALPLTLPKPPGTYSQLYKTEIRDFYSGDFSKPPNDDEVTFFEITAKPVFNAFRAYLHGRSAEQPYSFEVDDLFSGRRISATLSHFDYEQLYNFVTQSYLNFKEPMPLPETSST